MTKAALWEGRSIWNPFGTSELSINLQTQFCQTLWRVENLQPLRVNTLHSVHTFRIDVKEEKLQSGGAFEF